MQRLRLGVLMAVLVIMANGLSPGLVVADETKKNFAVQDLDLRTSPPNSAGVVTNFLGLTPLVALGGAIAVTESDTNTFDPKATPVAKQATGWTPTLRQKHRGHRHQEGRHRLTATRNDKPWLKSGGDYMTDDAALISASHLLE